MSLETLILLILFVLAPLLQQLLRRGTQPVEQPPAPRPAPAPRSAPPPRQGTAEAPVPGPPPAPRSAPPRPPAIRERPRAAWSPAIVAAPVPEPRHARRRPAAPIFGTPADLRRAIVYMTVLGPCRAETAYTWPPER